MKLKIDSPNIILCKLQFKGKSNDEYIIYYIQSLMRNGQAIYGEYFIKEVSLNTREVCLYLPTKDSINTKWNSFYVTKWQEVLINMGCKISYHLIDENDDSETMEVEFLIFGYRNSHFHLYDGNSFTGIPIYNISKYIEEKDEHIIDNIHFFIKDFDALDTLETSDFKFNRSVIKELYNINSKINTRGIEISTKIEKMTGIPTYYYLNHYTYNTSIQKELHRSLSLEKNSTTYIDLTNNNYQLINPSSRIVSNITPNLLDKCIALFNKEKLELKSWDKLKKKHTI